MLLKIKNGILLKLREAKDISSIRQLSFAIPEVSYQFLCQLCNLTSHYSKHSHKSFQIVANFFNVIPEALVPEDILIKVIKNP